MVSKQANRDKSLQLGIFSNQNADKTSNQSASHPANSTSVEANDSLPKDKEKEMNKEKLQILKTLQLDLIKDLTCSICFEVFVKPVKLPCQHTFCKACFLQWEQNKMNCPYCRAKYEKRPGEDALLASFIEKLLVSTYTDDENKQRDELTKLHASLESWPWPRFKWNIIDGVFHVFY